MPRQAKIALVAVVLIGGLVLAWRFRKPHGAKSAPAAVADTASTSTGAPAIAQDTSSLFSGSPSTASQSQPSAPPLDLSANSTTQASANPPVHAVAASALPDMAPKPEAPSVKPPPTAPAENAADDNPWHTAAGSSAPAGNQPTMPATPPSFAASQSEMGDSSGYQNSPLPLGTPLQTHKIVDGDSLPLLAERYLGSAARANDIFACNRDVLSDPEVLPIGVRLRIPTGMAQSQPTNGRADPPVSDRPVTINTTQQSVSPSATAESTLPTTLAQSNPSLTSTTSSGPASTAPLLSLGSSGLTPLPPMTGSERSAGKIYIVQNGDTLPGIAQKIYGDSAHADQLLQANREQLTSAQDLRPGMILETP